MVFKVDQPMGSKKKALVCLLTKESCILVTHILCVSLINSDLKSFNEHRQLGYPARPKGRVHLQPHSASCGVISQGPPFTDGSRFVENVMVVGQWTGMSPTLGFLIGINCKAGKTDYCGHLESKEDWGKKRKDCWWWDINTTHNFSCRNTHNVLWRL